MNLLLEPWEVRKLLKILKSLNTKDCQELASKIKQRRREEKAISKAALCESREQYEEMTKTLKSTLTNTDPFWVLWNFKGKKRGWK